MIPAVVYFLIVFFLALHEGYGIGVAIMGGLIATAFGVLMTRLTRRKPR